MHECEADMVGAQLLSDKKPLINLLTALTKKTGKYEHEAPTDDHPSGKQRVQMLQQPNILSLDAHRIHLNDHCEMIEHDFVPPGSPSSPTPGNNNKARAV